jgi:hypothetical protein
MREANKIQVQHPWCNIVTTQGDTPWVMGKNDGVVTIASQKHHGKDMDLVEVEYNHYEVVLSNRVIQIIQERLSK